MSLNIMNLNDDVIKDIFCHLNLQDLLKLSKVNRRFYLLINDEDARHWKQLTTQLWMVTSKTTSLTWKEICKNYYSEYGEFVSTYYKFKPLWDRFKKFLKEKCPLVYNTLRPGLSKKELEDIQKHTNIYFPKCMKLFYRFCNGQEHNVFEKYGIFGNSGHFVYKHTPVLLDAENLVSAVTLIAEDFGKNISTDTPSFGINFKLKNNDIFVLPITYSLATANLSNEGSVLTVVTCRNSNGQYNEYVTLVNWEYLSDLNRHYVVGNSFEDWVMNHMLKSVSGAYPVDNGRINHCENDPQAVAKTGCITVKVGWNFCLDVHGREYFAYRITMEMDTSANQQESCQLESRYWLIKDFDTKEISEVRGPGVVGRFPIMKPGEVFHWTSCTSFSKNGSMEGHFVMKLLHSEKLINIKCPKFTMTEPKTLTEMLN